MCKIPPKKGIGKNSVTKRKTKNALENNLGMWLKTEQVRNIYKNRNESIFIVLAYEKYVINVSGLNTPVKENYYQS